MSTQIDQFVILGAKFEYEAFKSHYETLEPYMDRVDWWPKTNSPGVVCVFDGMNGDYVVLGRILGWVNGRKAVAFDKMIEFNPIPHQTALDMAHATQEINEVLDLCGLSPIDKVGLLIFSHYH